MVKRIKRTVVLMLSALLLLVSAVSISGCKEKKGEEKDPRQHVTIVLWVYDGSDNKTEYRFTEENKTIEATLPYDGKEKRLGGEVLMEDGSIYPETVLTGISGYTNPEGFGEKRTKVLDRGRYLIVAGFWAYNYVYGFDAYLKLTIE